MNATTCAYYQTLYSTTIDKATCCTTDFCNEATSVVNKFLTMISLLLISIYLYMKQ